MKKKEMLEIFGVTAIICVCIAVLFLIGIIDPIILLIAIICIIILISWIAVALSMWRIAEMQKKIDSILEIAKKFDNRQ